MKSPDTGITDGSRVSPSLALDEVKICLEHVFGAPENVLHRAPLETNGMLAEGESTVRMLLDTSPQAILAVDAAGSIVWVNHTAAAMFRYDEQKTLQKLAAANERDIRTLTNRLLNAQEEESRRVAREIHDSLGQHLGVLAADIGDVADGLPASSPARQRLRAVRTHAIGIAEEARRFAHQLHPSILEDLGLPTVLQNLCYEFRQREHIFVKFQVRGPIPLVPIEAASCAYRIALEALSNVAAHARAKKVAVLLTVRRFYLQLSIHDNGTGFDPNVVQGAGGLGLVSMRERARLANGELSVDAKPGHGTCVKLALRLPHAAT